MASRIEHLGDRALRVPRPAASARAIVREIRTWPGVVDVVVAREDVAIYFDRAPSPADVRSLAALVDTDEPARQHVLRVIYDGPDLDEVARATGLTVDQVIDAHTATTFTVETMGFQPGFAYLDGLDPRLELPRRTTPRERVPAGAVAIVGRQSAVYPFSSPGGWHLLGRVVDARMFDEHGPLLALGDQVRFTR